MSPMRSNKFALDAGAADRELSLTNAENLDRRLRRKSSQTGRLLEYAYRNFFHCSQ